MIVSYIQGFQDIYIYIHVYFFFKFHVWKRFRFGVPFWVRWRLEVSACGGILPDSWSLGRVWEPGKWRSFWRFRRVFFVRRFFFLLMGDLVFTTFFLSSSGEGWSCDGQNVQDVQQHQFVVAKTWVSWWIGPRNPAIFDECPAGVVTALVYLSIAQDRLPDSFKKPTGFIGFIAASECTGGLFLHKKGWN